MKTNTLTVSRKEMEELQRLARMVNDPRRPAIQRRIAKAQYQALMVMVRGRQL